MSCNANGSSALSCYAEVAWNATIIPRANFYIVTPSETTFASMDDVPNYAVQSVPFWFALMFLEILVARWMGKRPARVNDSFSSISAGMIQQMSKVLLLSFETICYVYLYNNYRVVDLPWDSRWLWWGCVLGYDLGYYFAHRAGHEINFLWAAHQVHHSSESYNLTTALRQSVFQGVFFWVFYLPLALVIPPSIFKTHSQFNLIYQFWIHTELIDNLGPLEWILNTPSHHRVHHGRNEKCLDKNYAAVFIIWDRIFGTFEPEPREKNIAYGLVYPLDFWDPIAVQIHYYQYIFKKAWDAEGIFLKLQILFRGPGWTPPGEEVVPLPEVQYPVKVFNRSLPSMLLLYLFLHNAVLSPAYMFIMDTKTLPPLGLWLCSSYILLALTAFGMLFDHKWYGPIVELCRVSTGLLISLFSANSVYAEFIFPIARVGEVILGASILFWIVVLIRQSRSGKPYWSSVSAKKSS